MKTLLKTLAATSVLAVCVGVLLAVAYVGGYAVTKHRIMARLDCRILAVDEALKAAKAGDYSKRHTGAQCDAMITDFDVRALAFYCPECKALKKP